MYNYIRKISSITPKKNTTSVIIRVCHSEQTRIIFQRLKLNWDYLMTEIFESNL